MRHDHPQLWVYAPSSVPNQAPSAVVLNNQVNAVAENTSTATRIKVADVAVIDDGLGTNNLTVTGPDAGAFEVDSIGLYIKAGTILDFETKAGYSVTVSVDDPNVGAAPDATAPFALAVTDVANENPVLPSLVIRGDPVGQRQRPLRRRLVRGDKYRRQRPAGRSSGHPTTRRSPSRSPSARQIWSPRVQSVRSQTCRAANLATVSGKSPAH